MDTSKQQSSQQKEFWIRAAIIFVIAVLVYLPALFGGFLWDDVVSLTENHLIGRRDGLFYFWFTSAPISRAHDSGMVNVAFVVDPFGVNVMFWVNRTIPV